ncbi:MAG: SDR family NAD(P)-dependent oxidoreductase [Anaeroplasmataceae bacterium]|nr:SDR family NAD(P)-dependent oxidoreductase [Anaeroplasmataceae bacterium]
MKKLCVLGSTGVLGQELVSCYKNENCIEASRSLENDINKIQVDLSNFRSVCDFIDRISKEKLDVLFINSGVYEQKKYTLDGYEYNFMVNAFSPYYIVKRLLALNPNCRIVFTSSISILHAKQELNPKNWKKIYRNTKLIAHLLFQTLEELFPTSIITYAHPGIVPSKLSYGLHSKKLRSSIRIFGNTPSKGARCIIEASKAYLNKNFWIVPSGIFSLRGKPKPKKIKKTMILSNEIKIYIKQIEKELEEKYGI